MEFPELLGHPVDYSYPDPYNARERGAKVIRIRSEMLSLAEKLFGRFIPLKNKREEEPEKGCYWLRYHHIHIPLQHSGVSGIGYIYVYITQFCMSAVSPSTHSPTLDTIRMIEEFVQEHSGEYRRRALWSSLPRKMMYQTFKTAIDYLIESNKIALDANNTVCWIFDPELARYYMAREELRIR